MKEGKRYQWKDKREFWDLLTYHTSESLGAEEALAARHTVCCSLWKVFRVLQINLFGLMIQAAAPARLTTRDPCCRVAIPIRFQVPLVIRFR